MDCHQDAEELEFEGGVYDLHPVTGSTVKSLSFESPGTGFPVLLRRPKLRHSVVSSGSSLPDRSSTDFFLLKVRSSFPRMNGWWARCLCNSLGGIFTFSSPS